MSLTLVFQDFPNATHDVEIGHCTEGRNEDLVLAVVSLTEADDEVKYDELWHFLEFGIFGQLLDTIIDSFTSVIGTILEIDCIEQLLYLHEELYGI
jgi:hypothetical protein